MSGPAAHILQLTDSVTGRQAALRLFPGHEELALGALMDFYLKHAPLDQLRLESRITGPSADSLYALQDLVYASSDGGQLEDMFAGAVFRDECRVDSPITRLNEVPASRVARAAGQEISLIDITIDRLDVDYARNWTGFHARKWQRDPVKYEGFVESVLEETHGSEGARELMELDSRAGKLKFLKTLARAVWDSQFENYSRFTGKKLVYKSGDETIDNIIEGAGAICSEKVQALKFLTDHYGFESEYIIAGQDAVGPVPVEKLRQLLKTFDFRFSKRYMRYWQHTALLYHLGTDPVRCSKSPFTRGGMAAKDPLLSVDETRVLVDATNGNIPFLFLEGGAADRILTTGSHDNRDYHRNQRSQPVPVKMVESTEQFYYHRVPQDIPENLFFALEGWIPYSDLMQVFDNELGLYLSADYYVTPVPYRKEEQYRRDRQEFLDVANRAELHCSVTRSWTLDTPLGREFHDAEPKVSGRVLDAEEHLLARLDGCDGPGHESGLVVMKLRN